MSLVTFPPQGYSMMLMLMFSELKLVPVTASRDNIYYVTIISAASYTQSGLGYNQVGKHRQKKY